MRRWDRLVDAYIDEYRARDQPAGRERYGKGEETLVAAPGFVGIWRWYFNSAAKFDRLKSNAYGLVWIPLSPPK
jgi:hypothetical protein